MNRRTFLQSMSAAFSAVALGLRPAFTEPPKIRYELFCDPSARRYDLGSPFCVDGSIYATDSRLLITHPGEWTGTNTARVPEVQKLWWGEFDKPGWKELPAQQLEPRPSHVDSYCPLCMGLGRIGADVHRNPLYNEDDENCREREWIGGSLCRQCEGKGWPDDFSHHETIGGGMFCPALMNRLRTLGGLDYRVAAIGPDRVVPSEEAHLLLLRGDNGVRAMLMGMSY